MLSSRDDRKIMDAKFTITQGAGEVENIQINNNFINYTIREPEGMTRDSPWGYNDKKTKVRVKLALSGNIDAAFDESKKKECYEAILNSLLADDLKSFNPPDVILEKAKGIALEKVK